MLAIATTFASFEVNGAATDASPNLIVGGSESSSSINVPNILSLSAADNSSGVFFSFAEPFGFFSGTETFVEALDVEDSALIIPFSTPFVATWPSLLFANAANAFSRCGLFAPSGYKCAIGNGTGGARPL